MFVKLKNMTPFKLCVIQEFPFIEADFDAVTSYQLLCKVVEYLNKVIAAENAQNDNINELNEAINALTNYVNEIGEKVDDFDEEFTTKTLKAISLILSGNATIGGNLVVDGELSLNDKATIDAPVDIKQDLMVDGFTNLKSAELEGDLIVGGDLSINGKEAATVDMIPDISGKLDKTGGTISGNLAVTGALTKGGVTVATVNDIPGPVDISGKYDKTGGTISGDVNVTGKVTVGNSHVEPNIINSPVITASNYMSTPKILNPTGKFGTPILVDSKLNITNGVTLGADSTMNGVKLATVDDIPVVTGGDMSYKGTVGTGGTVTDLPAPTEANKGDVYKVVEDGEYHTVVTDNTNLFSTTRIQNYGWIIDSQDALKVDVNTNYVISWYTTDKNVNQILLEKGGSGNWITATSDGNNRYYYSFNTGYDTRAINFRFRNGNQTMITLDDVYNIQLEKGTTPSAYRPYVPPTPPVKAYKGDLFIGNISEWVHVPSGTAVTIEHDLTIDGNLTVTGTGIISADEITGVNSFSAKNGNFTENLSVADLDVSGSTVIDADVTINSDLLLTGDIDMSRGSGDIILATGRNIVSGDTNYIGVYDDDTYNIVIKSQEDSIEVLAYHDILIKATDNVNITATEQSVNINSADTLTIQTSADGNITSNDNLNMTSSEDEVHINGANGIYIRQTNDDNSSQMFLDGDGWFGVEANKEAQIKVKNSGDTTNTDILRIDNGLTFNNMKVATIDSKKYNTINFDAQTGTLENEEEGLLYLKNFFDTVRKSKLAIVYMEVDFNGDSGYASIPVFSDSYESGYHHFSNEEYAPFVGNLLFYQSGFRVYVKSSFDSDYVSISYNANNNTFSTDGWDWSENLYMNYIRFWEVNTLA